uniref:DNA helicase n=1 Tax=Caenorhabditis tropicalis TaxID=1561998 RepID=A0A1I7T145_9PELO
MLLGTIMHEIFQTAITSKKRPLVDSDLLKIWSTQAPRYAEELVALSFTPSCLDTELQPYFKIICEWINKHYPISNSFFTKRELLPSKAELLEVYDIEENIWDSKLGLKGKVDVTIRTKSKKGIESLELKTGKSNNSCEHAGQVLLYCMMQSSRHEQPIGLGNILYLKDGVSRCVTPRAAELFGILQQRNNLSVHFEDPTTNLLPPPRQESRFCDKCDQKVMCSFYQKTEENYEKSTEALKNFAENEMSHLKQSHIDYVSNWIRWISAEWKCERERIETHSKDLWLEKILDRVVRGTCLADLIPINEEISNSQRIIISFKKSTNVCPFKAGDVCLLSNQKHVAIGFAVVDSVSEDIIKVSSDKAVKSRYAAPFHLDKYTSMGTHSITLGNLVCFLQNDEIGKRLRDILVDMLPPIVPEITGIGISPAIKKIIVRAKLNNEQRRAVIHALSTEDFMMIEGLPGSGKTSLISVLIQCMVATKKAFF